MLYLLDANVLIRAHEDYYPLDRVPQFWCWLIDVAGNGHVKMPFEIHAEIAMSNGPLKDWICSTQVKDALILDEEVHQTHLHRVINQGYAADLTDDELEQIGHDPFLAAYGLVSTDRVIVTKEVSKPSKKRANRKLPDVCSQFGVRWMNDFTFYRVMGFKITS